MDNKNIFEKNKFSGKKRTYYIILVLGILAIALISFFSYKSIQNSLADERIDNVTDNTDMVDRNLTDVKETPKVENTEIKEHEPAPEIEPEPESTPQPAVESKAYIMPVDGEISTNFSLKTPVYSKTLKDWRIHDGVDILAELGADVVAVNDGAVEKISSDDLFGITVIIKHTDGTKSTYSNLEDSVELEEGQIINRGDKIGKIGKTAVCEIADGPHLHFEMSLNGEKIDPMSVIK